MQKHWWSRFSLEGFETWQLIVRCGKGTSAPDLLGQWTIHFSKGSVIQVVVLSWSFGSMQRGETLVLGII